MRLLLAVALMLLLPALSWAKDGGWQCWADASSRYNVPVDLLYAIARVETGNRAHLVSARNKNGTYDIGLMQINSMHLPSLAKYGIRERDLLTDPCLNLHVGAWILAGAISRHGYNWTGIGAYNAGTTERRRVYAKKVFAMYRKILRERERVALADTREKVN